MFIPGISLHKSYKCFTNRYCCLLYLSLLTTLSTFAMPPVGSTALLTVIILLFSLLTTLSTFAMPPVGSTALLTVIILLTALNIPAEEVTLLYAMEWFLWVHIYIRLIHFFHYHHLLLKFRSCYENYRWADVLTNLQQQNIMVTDDTYSGNEFYSQRKRTRYDSVLWRESLYQ